MSKILVVDDRMVSRQVITNLLGYFDHQLFEAADGIEALEVARGTQPDLIIADILMPTMDGFELVRRLRLDPATALTPVIFYTASYLEREARQLAASCGVSHFIIKPSEPEIILQTVSAALGETVPTGLIPSTEKFHESHLEVLTGKLNEVIPRLAALINVGKQLIGERNPQQLVQDFCHAAREVMGARYAAVGIFGDDGQSFAHFITSGMSPAEITRIGTYPTGRGLLQYTMTAVKPFRINDMSTHPHSIGFPAHHPLMRSFLGAPIMTDTRRYGVFYFTDKIGDSEFTEQDEKVAETLAVQIGIAYENALRYAEIQREVAERRQAEEALRKSEERYRGLFQNLPIGLFRTDFAGNFLDANSAMLQMHGFPDLATLQKINAADLTVVPGASNPWLALLREQGIVRDYEVQLKRYNGQSIWCQINARLVTNDEGQPSHIEGSVQDITERKQAHAELNALHNALSSLFTSGNLKDLSQQIVEAIVREFRMVDCGLMLVDESEQGMVRLARAGDYEVATDVPIYLDGPGLVAEAVRSDRTIYIPDVNVDSEYRYVANDARTRSELVIPLRTNDGVIGILDLQSPQTDAFSQENLRVLRAFAERAALAVQRLQLNDRLQLHAEELEWRVAERTAQLEATKDHIEAILNNNSDAILVVGLNGRITDTNPAFTLLFGYTAEEVFEKPLSMLFESDERDKVHEVLASAVVGQASLRSEAVALHANGARFDVDSVLSPIKESADGVIGIVCSLRDITVRRKMEEELRVALAKEKELNDLKSRFVSIVSHEFRTPLTVISSSAQMLQIYSERLSAERKQEHFARIGRQVNQMTNLLQDVLTLGKAETIGMDFNPQPVDIAQCCRTFVEEALHTLGSTYQILVTTQQMCEKAFADEKLLRHIVSNLLSNAMKYSPDKDKVYFDLRCANGQAIISVHDEGIGIPEEDQKRLFEAFHRATNVGAISGTGLGLSIVQRAVEAHGGTISFVSELGVGTTFTVAIPIASNET